MTEQRTLLICKPDAVQRRLVGRILDRVERKGLRPVAIKMLAVSESQARRLYAVHEGKDFHDPLVAFIRSAPVVAIVVEGPDAIAILRRLVGPTFGPEAPPGTIRGDFGLSRRYNLVHASDSPSSAKEEIAVFFEQSEIVSFPWADRKWLVADVDEHSPRQINPKE